MTLEQNCLILYLEWSLFVIVTLSVNTIRTIFVRRNVPNFIVIFGVTENMDLSALYFVADYNARILQK